MTSMKQPNGSMGTRDETGEKEPKGAKGSDSGGERKGRLVNGVALGKADGTGQDEGGVGRGSMGARPDAGEFNTGRTSGTIYNHKRIRHEQDR